MSILKYYEELSNEDKSNPIIALNFIKHGYYIEDDLPEILLNDYDFVLAAVKIHPAILQYSKLRENHNIVLAAMQANHYISVDILKMGQLLKLAIYAISDEYVKWLENIIGQSPPFTQTLISQIPFDI